MVEELTRAKEKAAPPEEHAFSGHSEPASLLPSTAEMAQYGAITAKASDTRGVTPASISDQHISFGTDSQVAASRPTDAISAQFKDAPQLSFNAPRLNIGHQPVLQIPQAA